MTTRRPLLAVALACLAACAGCTHATSPSRVPSPPVSATPVATQAADPSTATATPTPSATSTPSLSDLLPGLEPPMASFAQPVSPVAAPGSPVDLTVGPVTSTSPQLRPTNVGLSFEVTDLADPRWEPDGSPLTLLLSALDRPSLRFGGNSVDRRMWWTSSGETAPSWASATLTPETFQRLGRMAARVDASVTLVLDLGHSDPARAADMAYHAHAALGGRLRAVTIGNEPNGFALDSQPHLRMRGPGWGPDAFVAEARAYVDAVHARVPGLAVVGPGAFDAPWWRAFGAAALPGTAAMSQHWYPLWSCAGRTGTTDPRAVPSVANVTSPWLHERANFILGMGRDTASRYGLGVWLEETGPTSCPGNEASRTLGQALWSVDFVLNAARNGVARTNMHSSLMPCDKGNPMSTVCTASKPGRTPTLRGESNFLSLMLVAQAGEGAMREVSVAGDDRVFSYAIETSSGIDVLVVNFNDPARTGPSPLTVHAPAGLHVTHASQLSGDSLAATSARLVPMSRATAETVTTVGAGSALLIRFGR